MHQLTVITKQKKMSKIHFTTRVPGLNEDLRALASSIARFLGKPIEPDDLSRLASDYQLLVLYANKLKRHEKCDKFFEFYRDLYEKKKKEFYSFLKELHVKYSSQLSIQYDEYNTQAP